MEAKDTVNQFIKLNLHTLFYDEIERIKLEQAAISFNAGMEAGKDFILKSGNMADILHQSKQEGIKEVVDWVNKIDIVDECCITEWQAKVKEWLGE